MYGYRGQGGGLTSAYCALSSTGRRNARAGYGSRKDSCGHPKVDSSSQGYRNVGLVQIGGILSNANCAIRLTRYSSSRRACASSGGNGGLYGPFPFQSRSLFGVMRQAARAISIFIGCAMFSNGWSFKGFYYRSRGYHRGRPRRYPQATYACHDYRTSGISHASHYARYHAWDHGAKCFSLTTLFVFSRPLRYRQGPTRLRSSRARNRWSAATRSRCRG